MNDFKRLDCSQKYMKPDEPVGVSHRILRLRSPGADAARLASLLHSRCFLDQKLFTALPLGVTAFHRLDPKVRSLRSDIWAVVSHPSYGLEIVDHCRSNFDFDRRDPPQNTPGGIRTHDLRFRKHKRGRPTMFADVHRVYEIRDFADSVVCRCPHVSATLGVNRV